MTYMLFLIAQATYTDIEIGLVQGDNLLEKRVISKLEASKKILIAIDELLRNHSKNIDDLSFIAGNRGPGPFTTLRVALVTLNGLSYATSIPLIGLNGLNLFLEENRSQQFPLTVALLDAFTKDVYVGIDNHGVITISCEHIESLLQRLKHEYLQPIRFIGSGCTVYHDQIKNILGSQAIIAQPLPAQSTLEYLSKKATEQWNTQEITSQLEPLYLKNVINNIVIR